MIKTSEDSKQLSDHKKINIVDNPDLVKIHFIFDELILINFDPYGDEQHKKSLEIFFYRFWLIFQNLKSDFPGE